MKRHGGSTKGKEFCVKNLMLSCGQNVEQMKLDTKEYVFCDSIQIKVKNRQDYPGLFRDAFLDGNNIKERKKEITAEGRRVVTFGGGEGKGFGIPLGTGLLGCQQGPIP